MKKIFLSLIALVMTIVSANAEDFKILSTDPAIGSAVTGIARSASWKFSSNMDGDANFKAISYSFTDATTGAFLYTSTVTKAAKYSAADGMWTIKNYSAALADFKKGHQIVLKITALDNEAPSQAQTIGVDSITWIGDGSADFVYSPAKFISITPEAGTELLSSNDNTFVLTFSEGVRLDKTKSVFITGQSETASFQSITASEDSTTWTLVAKSSTIGNATPQIYMNVYGTDLKGQTLEGNNSGAYQLEDKSYYKFKYECYLGSPALNVTPVAGIVESLKDFKLTYSGGINYSYAAALDSITITNEAGEVVSTISAMEKDGALYVDAKDNAYATFSLPTAITKNGKYTLNIPSKIFALGTEFDGFTSKAQKIQYTISNDLLAIASCDPASGSELAKVPAPLTITFNHPDAVAYANWDVVDLNPDDPENPVVFSAEFSKLSDGSFVSKAAKWVDVLLYQGHSYQLRVKAYADINDYNYGNSPSATFTDVVWKGTTASYAYSPATLVGTEPAEQSTITTGEITVTFSGAVASVRADVIGGLTGNYACGVLAGNDGNKTWKIVIPKSVINASTGSININLVAQDADGLYVKGNQGAEPDTTTVISFNCYEGCPAPATIEPVSGSTVEKLDVITFGDSQGINLSYNATSDITVTKDGELVCTVPTDSVEVENVAYGKVSTYCKVKLPMEITEAGTYQVNVPVLYFILGEEFASNMTKAMTLTYTIAGASKTGDVNGDGQVDISDVNAVISVICGTSTNANADVNKDGSIDISDVNAIISEICGK